jgi:hypothetical protein
LGGFISCVENLVIIGWSLVYAGIKKANNKWTYDPIDHLIKKTSYDHLILETIFALAPMIYVVNLDAYELHLRDENVFNNYMINSRVFSSYI